MDHTSLGAVEHGLNREQMRNLKKAVGAEAADMVNECRKLVGQTLVAQQHLARECQALRTELETGRAALDARADGLGEWSHKNEERINGLATAAKVEAMALDELKIMASTAAANIEELEQQTARIDRRTYRPRTFGARVSLLWAWLFTRQPIDFATKAKDAKVADYARIIMGADKPETCTRDDHHDGPCNGFPREACLQTTAPAEIHVGDRPNWIPTPTYDHTPIDSRENPCLICKALEQVHEQLQPTAPPAGLGGVDEAAALGAAAMSPRRGHYFDDTAGKLRAHDRR